MYPRVEFEMSENDLKELLEASKPVPCMMIGGYTPSSPQENANRAWARLGKKMNFDPMTVKPIQGKGQRFFTAVPTETPEQKKEREAKEAEEKRLARIGEIKEQKKALDEELKRLEDSPNV